MLDRDITIQRLFLNGSALLAMSNLTLNEGLTITGGSLNVASHPSASVLTLANGSSSTISGGGISYLTVNNSGTVNMLAGAAQLVLNNLASGVWNITQPPNDYWQSSTINNAGSFVIHGNFYGPYALFQNSGSVMGDADSTLELVHGNGASTNSGAIDVGELLIGDQDFNLAAGATVNAKLLYMSEGNLHITGAAAVNANLELQHLGELYVQSGATLTLNGTLKQLQETSNTYLNGGTITSSQPLDLQLGRLSGSGTINGDVNNNAVISPGGAVSWGHPFTDSPGAIRINGNLSMLTDARLVMEIGGFMRGTQRDYLAVSGMVTLNGTLSLVMINGFQMQLNGREILTLLTSGNVITGMFTNVANGDRLMTSDGSASFQVNYGTGSLFDPDDIVLSDPMVVPEPTIFALLTIGAIVIGLVRPGRQ